MTYSIVARDPETRQMGVAVQTFNLAVGTWVPWAQGGIGAVATQALAERSYGTKGLAMMQEGKGAAETLSHLLAADSKREFRQVTMIDNQGEIATHTGNRCFPEAGSNMGDNYCVQANMMERASVWGAMAEAFEASNGDLAGRLLEALFAAEKEGGDLRGKQTAALLIVEGRPTDIPLVDLRVDHHPDPLGELRRLYSLHRGYMAEYAAADYAEAGDLDAVQAMLEKIEALAPGEQYLQYLRAMHLAGWLDNEEAALSILSRLFDASPSWEEYLRREAKVDNFGIPGLGDRLLEGLRLKKADD